MSRFETAEELAQRLHLRPSTIRRWAQEGIIPALRLSGKVVRFDPETVERALRERAAQFAQQGKLPHIVLPDA